MDRPSATRLPHVADRDLLDRALRSLEPEARSAIVMHYYLGMSVPEVADALGIPLGTAKSRLSRSLAQMRSVAGVEGSAALPRDEPASTSSGRRARVTPIDLFERQLPDGLADLADARMPSYLDDILEATSRTRQRPRWTFFERWLPLSLITVAPRSAPLRAAWTVLLVGLLAVGPRGRPRIRRRPIPARDTVR